MGAHRERVAVHEILRQHVRSGPVEVIRLVDLEVIGEDFRMVARHSAMLSANSSVP